MVLPLNLRKPGNQKVPLHCGKSHKTPSSKSELHLLTCAEARRVRSKNVKRRISGVEVSLLEVSQTTPVDKASIKIGSQAYYREFRRRSIDDWSE